jgi:hypothetical protein
METQTLLFNRSAELPEQLYVELMNKLKIDFDNSAKKTNVLVINRCVPRTIMIKKCELIQTIVRASVNWENREDILQEVTHSRITMTRVVEICDQHNIPVRKQNPRWEQQRALLNQIGNPSLRSYPGAYVM